MVTARVDMRLTPPSPDPNATAGGSHTGHTKQFCFGMYYKKIDCAATSFQREENGGEVVAAIIMNVKCL
jgi:hypothetical protein